MSWICASLTLSVSTALFIKKLPILLDSLPNFICDFVEKTNTSVETPETNLKKKNLKEKIKK